MPIFIVSGSKVMKDGTEHGIAETAPSRVKAEWIAAQYKAEGYAVTINEQRN
jgi:hypothetical protein